MEKKIEQIATKRGYVVTEEGHLLNSKGVEVGCSSGTIYHYIKIHRNRKKIKCYAHRLQAFQKYGDKLYEKEIEVRHLNGNPLDNSWNNILIGSHSDNMMDIPKQIRIKKAKHATSFVNKYDYISIMKDRERGMTYKELMEKYNISSKGTIGYIVRSNSKNNAPMVE